jgi:hypothetical protein
MKPKDKPWNSASLKDKVIISIQAGSCICLQGIHICISTYVPVKLPTTHNQFTELRKTLMFEIIACVPFKSPYTIGVVVLGLIEIVEVPS